MKKARLFILATVLVVIIILAAFLSGHLSSHVKKPTIKAGSSKASVKRPLDIKSVTNVVSAYVMVIGFEPSKLTISNGDTVKWDNLDAAQHSIIFSSSPITVTPSPSLSNGQTYSYKFTMSGNYSYHDGFNPNIKGSVTVK